MKNYASFLMFGALAVVGCSSAETGPASASSSVNSAGAGVPAAAVGGTSADPAAGSKASGTAGAVAASSGSATAGSSSAAAGMSAAMTNGGMMMAAPPPAGSWRAAYAAIFSGSSCAQCHIVGGVLGPPDFSTPDKAYDSLVDKDASMMAPAQCGGMGKLVTPGNCETSLVYHKLSQDTPKCGRRMPPSSDAAPMRVAPEKLEALCAWIKAGAKKD